MEYKNIIFDVDGTLLDSYTPYMNALEKAVYKFTGNILDDKTKDKLFHMTNDEIMEYVGVNPNEYEDFIEYNDSCLNVNEVYLYEDIEELKLDGDFVDIKYIENYINMIRQTV